MISCSSSFLFFFNDTATTEIYTLSLHDALPICGCESSWNRLISKEDSATAPDFTNSTWLVPHEYPPKLPTIDSCQRKGDDLIPLTGSGHRLSSCQNRWAFYHQFLIPRSAQ